MEHLVTELDALLNLLDQENLGPDVVEKKAVVRSLLKHLLPSAHVPDCTYMNTPPFGNGTRFVESLFEEFDSDFKELKNAEATEEPKGKDEAAISEVECDPQSLEHSASHLPPTDPTDNYYEEADPVGTDEAPQYIASQGNSTLPTFTEDGFYEDPDKNYFTTQLCTLQKTSDSDLEALSSSYESYSEGEERAKVQQLTRQRPSVEVATGPEKGSCIRAFLLRKRRFGQWVKQLTVIRDNRLQCYKSSKDHSPYIELPLNLCNVIYVPKDGRHKKHELRFSLPGGKALVLAVQSREQAEGWLTVIREVISQENIDYGSEGTTSPMILRKMELDQRQSSNKRVSSSDSVSASRSRNSCLHGKAKRRPLSKLTGSVSRAAGCRINQVINCPKKKPPVTPTQDDDNLQSGCLNVLTEQCWEPWWCSVRDGSLHLQQHRDNPQSRVLMIALRGCELAPVLDPGHPFAFQILKEGAEVVTMEACSSREMGCWLGVLLAETGCCTDPDALRYDYVDLDSNAVRQSFLWAAASSRTSVDSKLYSEIAYEEVQLGGHSPKPDVQRSPFSLAFNTKSDGICTANEAHGSNTNQYGKYGKIRAEEDARKYLLKKEELEKEREAIRNTLLSLRKEKKKVKEDLKCATGRQQRDLQKQLTWLEENCREKERERVDVELRLTQVKDSLKLSVARGMLGPPAESKTTCKIQKHRNESHNSSTDLSVTCTSETCSSPVPIYASTHGMVMQKAKEWELKKGT